MSKEKNKLIPELRFPEFEDDGEWVEKTLGEVCIMKAGKFVRASHIKEVFIEGLFPCYGGNGMRGYTKTYTHSGKFTLIGRQGALCGNVNLVDGTFHATEHAVVVTPEDNTDTVWLYYATVLLNLNQYATGQAQPGLSVANLEKVELSIPNSSKEQHKIASCLSSLDELIAAHNEKLELLRDHKKGLMQNLFPDPSTSSGGEKVPKYRFPEFEDDGEWVEKKLGDCLIQKPEYGINAPAVPYSDKLPTYLRITDISEHGNFLRNNKVSVDRDVFEDNFLSEGDIVLARTGASVGKSYKYRINDGKLVFAGFLIRVKPDVNKLNSELLFQFLFTSQYWYWVNFISARSGQPGINATEYSSMPICLPPTIEEQQKIASCLSSLDALITAESEKIEQLELHKKGLMQGLFPSS